MADQTYTYHGPSSGVTLKLEGGEQREVLFHPGRDVDLPADHPYVMRLIAQRWLVPVESRRARGSKTPADPGATETEEGAKTPTRTTRNKENV